MKVRLDAVMAEIAANIDANLLEYDSNFAALPRFNRLYFIFRSLDDRFHETGIDETGSMELEGCWWIPRLRLAERGAVSWQDGVKRSGGRGGMRGTRG